MINRSVFWLAAVPVALALGCGGGDNPSQSGAGGSVGLGGNTGAGGLTHSGGAGGTSASTGGPGNTGGAQSTGGASATGGAKVTGGASSAGGASAAGGVVATGGSKAATGGSKATGGAKATGGNQGAGGDQGAGGSQGGGAQATGGTNSGTTGAGGGEPVGGTKAAGGSVAAGGTKAAGGSVAVGGTKAAGGSAATGGSNAPGGASTAGGQTSSTGGSTSSPSCPATVLKSGDTKPTVEGREYILHVPSAYKGTTAVPLIVDFHPIGGTDTAEASGSPWKAVTDPEGVITVYPQGKSGPGGNAWNVGPCCVANVDDVAFAKAIVADVEKVACIDTKRVYAVGFSMGGGMTHYIGCHAADIFAAVAPTAFDLLGTSSAAPKGNVADCKPTRPISVLSFRGTGDDLVHYGGGDSSVVSGMPIYFLGAQACWKQWAQIDGCTDSPTYPATPNSATYNCAYYKQCQGNVQVGVCINNSGHAYATSAGAQTGWTFLKQFTMP